MPFRKYGQASEKEKGESGKDKVGDREIFA